MKTYFKIKFQKARVKPCLNIFIEMKGGFKRK